jgi:hypothetical protein
MKDVLSNKFFFSIISFIISAYVVLVFVKSPGINGYERAMFPEMVYGKAWKPFVYRALMPAAIAGIAALIPVKVEEQITTVATSNALFAKIVEKLKWESEYFTEYIIAFLLMLFSLWTFAFVLKKLFKYLFTLSDGLIHIFILIALFGLQTMFQYYSYIYDFPTLLLFTLGLYLMVKEDWKSFLALFIVSCFNKETTILLSLIFIIHFLKSEKIPRNLFIQLLITQLLIFLGVKIVLFILFINNPGALVEFHLIDHNILLFNGYTLTNFVVWLLIIFLITYRWNEKPKFLKDSMWIVLPLIILTLFLGFIDELRDYFEVYPVIVLLISFSVTRILGFDIESKDLLKSTKSI